MSLDIRTLDEGALLDGICAGELIDPIDIQRWRDAQGEAIALGAYDEDRLVGVLLARTGTDGTICTALSANSGGHATPYGLLLALADALPPDEVRHCRLSLRRADLTVRQAVETFGARPIRAGEGGGWQAALSGERLQRCRTPVSRQRHS